MAEHLFDTVTLLITHYNRSSSLERLLAAFRDLNCKFGDIVISDDGSKPENLEKVVALQSRFNFRLITTPKNKGLGNNINKGQDAVKTPYTLYVQEDFVPQAIFPACMSNAVQFMETRQELDIARFYAYYKYPYLTPFENGFSDMRFRIWYPGYKKFHEYSDHPHLRRSNFFEKFGRYKEGVKVEKSEYLMVISFLQNKGKAIFYEDFQSVFDQKNSSAEPSTVKRNFWRESGNPLVSLARHFYRHFKFNYDYFFLKPHNQN